LERHVQELDGETWGKRPLGRLRHRWEDIKMDLYGVGCGCMDWIELAKDRDRWRALVNGVMNLRVQLNAGNFLTRFKPVRFLRRTLLRGVRSNGLQVSELMCEMCLFSETENYSSV
jgi:hypothetical protein